MSCCFTSKCPRAREFFQGIEKRIDSVWNHRVVREMRKSVPGQIGRFFFTITVLSLLIAGVAKGILWLGLIAPFAVLGGLIIAKGSAILFGGLLVTTLLFYMAKKVVDAVQGWIADIARQDHG